MVRHGSVLPFVFLLLALPLAAADVPDYLELRAARPDGRVVTVSNLNLERDAYTFTFEEGTFHFLPRFGDETWGAVFLGRGAYDLEPATRTERRHLRYITGDENLEVLADRFTELVLFFTDDTADEILAAAPVTEIAPDARARAVYEEYLDRQKRKYQTNLHLRVLLDLLNRPDRTDGVFLAPVDGEKYAPALVVVDPLGIGTVSAQFSFLGGEEVAFLSTEENNDGFWYLSTYEDDAVGGRGKAVRPIADAEHYAIDTSLDGTRLEGEATIRLRPTQPGVRVLPLRILPKLRIESARLIGGANETELGVIQEEVEVRGIARLFRDEVADADAAVVFPAPLPQGEPVEIRVRYAGSDVVERTGDGFSVRARTSWYPNVGVFTDLATYDLTFRFPRRNDLVSVGRKVDESVEEGRRVARWKAERPMRVAGFNYGDFRRISREDDVTGLAVDVYTDKNWTKKSEDTMADALNAARVATAFFGPAPYGRLSVSQQVEWNFGQSWPSLVFLPTLALTTSAERVFGMEGADPRAIAGVNEFATTVGWHEVAHQWWGHEVGWHCYRDQWLSEGFSEFTAGLVLQFTENLEKYDRYWEQKRQDILLRRGAVANWDAGPISQGYRLGSRRAPQAAQAMIYAKGGFVLHMLRMMMRDQAQQNPDAAFIAMMRDFVSSWAGKDPSTADFKAVVERHMLPTMNAAGDGTMDWFFDQWIHGTDIPTLTSDLRAVESGGGKFRIVGTVTQKDVPDTFISVVPIYLDFGRGEVAKIGNVRLAGTDSANVDAEIPLPRAPRKVTINAIHDVLSR